MCIYIHDMRNAVHKLDGRVSGLNGFTVVLKMRSLLTAGFMSTKVKLAIPMHPQQIRISAQRPWLQRQVLAPADLDA